MPDYDLRNLGTRSFEQLIQALSVGAIGPGLSVFGDGADGAREATFRGAMNYPSSLDPWNGYLVVQAKFRQMPANDYTDADWLVTQLRSELEKFTDTDRDLEIPDFYILATNIKLSPIQSPNTGKGKKRRGGIEKIEAVFTEFSSRLPIKSYHIWHYDKLRTLIDNNPSVRKSYAAWITAGDVLSIALEKLQFDTIDFRDIMCRYLARELRSQCETRLQQAGHAGDGGTPLHDVFVDLPFWYEDNEFDFEQPDPEQLPNLIERATMWSGEKLDLATFKREHADSIAEDREIHNARFLVLGGPGQGKSSLTQFLVQIFRAKCLESMADGLITADVRAIVRGVKQRTQNEKIDWHGPPRFPIRVELPRLADVLDTRRKNGSQLSLLDYISESISSVSNSAVNTKDLRCWLGSYPWLIVLDGLDEVPASANRSSVITAINEFWDEVAQSNADVLMFITTRPQGYNDELDPRLYEKLILQPLPQMVALKYAERLADKQIVDGAWRKDVMSHLNNAISQDTTARLMQSPLQVAIMFTLVDQRGQAPSDRWRLFDNYYEVISNREKTKPHPVSEVIRSRKRDIDSIHQAAGLILQVSSEIGGGAESYLTPALLSLLVNGHLKAEGHEGESLVNLAQTIIGACMDRLVFLTSRVENRISFEVRSLQEFMAARQIMSGAPHEVSNRLHILAPKSHWRHVFQICAAKCFATPELSHFRDAITQICAEQDAVEDTTSPAFPDGGALLALSLIEDGIAYDQPGHLRTLTERALGVLNHGISPTIDSLVRACKPAEVRSTVRKRLSIEVGNPARHTRAATRRLLGALSTSDPTWPADLLLANWPGNLDESVPISEYLLAKNTPEILRHQANKVIEQTPFERLGKYIDQERGRASPQSGGVGAHSLLQLLYAPRGEELDIQINLSGTRFPVRLYCTSVKAEGNARLLQADIPRTPQWNAIRVFRDFAAAPSGPALEDAINELVQTESIAVSVSAFSLAPWPLGSALRLVACGHTVESVLSLAKEMKFGDHSAWLEAEQRWQKFGAVENDFLKRSEGVYFDGSIAEVGAPASRGRSFAFGASSVTAFESLLQKLPPGPLRSELFPLYLALLTRDFIDGGPSPELVEEAISSSTSALRLGHINALQEVCRSDFLVRAVEDAGRTGRIFAGLHDKYIETKNVIVEWYKSERNRRGLLPVLILASEEYSSLREVATALNRTDLDIHDGDTPQIGEAVGLLRMFSPYSDDFSPSDTVELLAACGGPALRRFLSIPEQNDVSVERFRRSVLHGLLSRSDSLDSEAFTQCLRALSAISASQKSGLHRREVWQELRFPDHFFDAVPSGLEATPS